MMKYHGFGWIIPSQREIYQNNQKYEIYTEMQWMFGI